MAPFLTGRGVCMMKIQEKQRTIYCILSYNKYEYERKQKEPNLAKLKHRSEEVSGINNLGIIAIIRAKMISNKNQSKT